MSCFFIFALFVKFFGFPVKRPGGQFVLSFARISDEGKYGASQSEHRINSFLPDIPCKAFQIRSALNALNSNDLDLKVF